MDLNGILADLYARKRFLDRTILELEKLQEAGKWRGFLKSPKVGRRGRKSMSEAERAQVSIRMKLYWTSRRTLEQAAGSS
jgi:hypothetical protein